jgi:hypothetical protein
MLFYEAPPIKIPVKPLDTSNPLSFGDTCHHTGFVTLEFMAVAVRIAGLLHDIGKGTTGFNEKLRKAVDLRLERGGAQDPVRHELISTMLIDVEDPEYFLGELASPATIVSAFEARRAWLASRKTRAELEIAMDLTLSIEGDREPTDFDLAFFLSHLSLNSRENWQKNPFWMSVMWLVMTHHRLPSGAWSERRQYFMALSGRHLAVSRAENGRAAIAQRAHLSKFLDMPAKDQPWFHQEWVDELCSAIQTLRSLRHKYPDFEQGMFSSVGMDIGFGATTPWLSTLTRVGRLCLVMGDYEASCDSSKEQCNDPAGRLIANTKQVDGKTVFADTLHTHLVKVGRHAPRILRQLFISRDQEFFRPMSVRESEKPMALTTSWPVCEGPFAWQDTAQQTFAELQDSEAGLFCVVAAGTGKGKTRACAAMMTASRTNPRFSVLLSMRSLTFQTAKAYLAENIGFRPDQVAMLVGDSVLKKRFLDEKQAACSKLDMTPNIGTDNNIDEQGEYCVLLDSDEGAMIRLQSLQEDHTLMRLLSAPVSVMTIDHLMRLVDLSRSKETLQMLHLMSTDLIIDEVDMYAESDLICLGRLVEMAGQFGRRVIIASATLPRVVVEALRDSYLKGYETYQLIYGVPDARNMVVTHIAPYVSHHAPGSSFGEFYQEVLERFVAQESILATQLSRRRVINAQNLFDQKAKKDPRYDSGVLLPGTRGGSGHEEQYFEKCLEVVRVANQRFALTDAQTSIQYSIGFVRLNTVRSAQAMQKWLETSGICTTLAEKGVIIKTICYHAQTLGVSRSVQEEFLERHLNRTRMNNGESDPLLDSSDIRRSLNDAIQAEAKTVIYIVLTSSIIETGRDLDFDWCVLEPCSTTSIVQAGGRVRRHRTEEVDKANIFVMPLSLKAMKDSDDAWRGMKGSGYAPAQEPLKHHANTMSALGVTCAGSPDQAPVTTTRAFSRDLLRSDVGLHAGHCLLIPKSYSLAPLTVMERVKQMGWLSIEHARMDRDKRQSHHTLEYARQHGDVLLSNVFYANSRFRDGEACERIEYLRSTHSWCRLNARDQVTDANYLVSCQFAQPGRTTSIHLLQELNVTGIQELLELCSRMAQRLGFSPRYMDDADHTMLGAQISVHRDVRSIRFSPQSGLTIHP